MNVTMKNYRALHKNKDLYNSIFNNCNDYICFSKYFLDIKRTACAVFYETIDSIVSGRLKIERISFSL